MAPNLPQPLPPFLQSIPTAVSGVGGYFRKGIICAIICFEWT